LITDPQYKTNSAGEMTDGIIVVPFITPVIGLKFHEVLGLFPKREVPESYIKFADVIALGLPYCVVYCTINLQGNRHRLPITTGSFTCYRVRNFSMIVKFV